MCLLFTQMDRSLPFLVALLILGSLIISMDVFPNQWGKVKDTPVGYHIIRTIKGLSLSLIVIAFWIRLYENMYQIKQISEGKFKEEEIEIEDRPDRIYGKLFEVVLNLIVVSILPLVGGWLSLIHI